LPAVSLISHIHCLQVKQLTGKNAMLMQDLSQLQQREQQLQERISHMEKQSGALIAENIKLSGALIAVTKQTQHDRAATRASDRTGPGHTSSWRLGPAEQQLAMQQVGSSCSPVISTKPYAVHTYAAGTTVHTPT
jgi:hypothetical protein